MIKANMDQCDTLEALERLVIKVGDEPTVTVDTDILDALLKLIRAQHAIIEPLNHHSEFGGDYDIVEALNMYDELSEKV